MKLRDSGYSDDDREVLNKLRSILQKQRIHFSIGALKVPLDLYEKYENMMGRYPTWEWSDDKNDYDYDKPITVNNRFTDNELAVEGIQNLMFMGVPITPDYGEDDELPIKSNQG